MICKKKLKFRPRYLLYLLSALAVFNFAKWLNHFISTEYRPLDFRTYYLAGETYQAGLNPYDEHDNETVWLKQFGDCTTGEWISGIGIPHAAVVYAPQFIWFFSAFNAFDFTTAKWVQFVLNIICLFGICILIHKLQVQFNLRHIIIALAAFRGTWFALDNGQPLIAISFIILLSLFISKEKERPLWSGLLLGIVGFKFTLLIPIVFWLLLNNRFNTIAVMIITCMALNVPIIMQQPVYLNTWMNNMNSMWQYIHSGSLNGLSIINCNISSAVATLINVRADTIKTVSGVLYFLSLTYSFYLLKTRKLYDHHALFILILAEICFGQHLMYDLLLPVSIFLLTKTKANNYIELPLLLLLTFPIGSISDFLEFPQLNYALPLTLLTYLIYHYSTLPPSKYKEIKNPN